MATLERITNRKKLQLVFKLLCNHFGHEPDTVKQRSRKREMVVMRQIYYYFAKKYLSRITLTEIGGFLGYDHATVIHGYTTISGLMDTDKRFALQMSEADHYFRVEVLPKIDSVDPRNIPANKYQKIKFEKNVAQTTANRMYYIAKKFLIDFNTHINEDRIIEGFRRKDLDNKYWEALKELEKVKNNHELTIS